DSDNQGGEGFGQSPGPSMGISEGFAVTFNRASGPSQPNSPGNLTIRQGSCFRFALPEGWQVVEEGQFAVVMMAADRRAITMMVGHAGYPSHYNPAQFIFEKLSRSGLDQLRIGPGRPVRPLFGWPIGWEFDTDHAFQGIPCRGVARCSVAPSYDCCSIVMIWAASESAQWGRYASWLPAVAERVEVLNAAAFGAAGIAQQNLHNSIMIGEHARRNRDWSERQWAEVTRHREASQARQHFEFQQAMDGVRRYDNPYDNQYVDLPSTNAVYWIHPVTGQIVGDPNPTFDPRTAYDSAWQPLRPTRPPQS
ncbi:MAG: hypothetical protein AB7I30_15960, partial [Isosphaeraceae bacterium]